MATLKDVAKLANVDVSTVSRALNNTSYVHPDTKAKIMACAKELGYRPNAMAQALRQGRMHTIGVVVPRLRLTIFSEVTSGIDEQAQALGYTNIICITKDDPETEKECLNRLRGSVDGIIIAATGKNGRLLRDISASGIPVVQVIRKQERKFSSIVSDNEQGSYDAVKFLAGKGCKAIGLVNGPKELGPYSGRLAGYDRAVRDLGLEAIYSDSAKSILTYDHGYECARQLLEENPDLDAIVAATDIQGLGVIRAVKDFGKKVPDDIRVLSLTGHRIGKMLETTMSAMEVPSYEIGNMAVKTVVAEIEAPEGKRPSPQQISYMPTLVEREST